MRGSRTKSRRATPLPKADSELEAKFLLYWRALAPDYAPAPVRQYKFDPIRKWSLDFAWIEQKVAVEIEGGTWMEIGGHTSGKGYEDDCYKYNALCIAGWRLLRYTTTMLDYPVLVIGQVCQVLGYEMENAA